MARARHDAVSPGNLCFARRARPKIDASPGISAPSKVTHLLLSALIGTAPAVKSKRKTQQAHYPKPSPSMTASYDSRVTWANIDTELKDEVILKIAATLECLVCSELMHVPFLAQCGHSFCYGCLNAWFDSKVNCPTCRKDMENAPVLNIQLRDVSKTISDVVIDSMANESQKKLLLESREQAIDEFDQDNRRGSLFGDAFKSTLTLVDTSDGVPRCGNCHWEAHGSVCLHCGSRFRVPRSDLYYDSEDGEAYNEDQDEVETYGIAGEEDAYDSEDSFVDDRDITAINGDDYEDEDDGLPPDLDEEGLSAELWEGFVTRGGSSVRDDNDSRAWLDEDSNADSRSESLESAIDQIHQRDVTDYMDVNAEEALDEEADVASIDNIDSDRSHLGSGDEMLEDEPGTRSRRTHWVVDLDSE